MKIRLIIITVPPAAIVEAMQAHRRKVAAITGAKAAMAYPPHITLRTGAMVPCDRIDSYVQAFYRRVQNEVPFVVRTDGIDFRTYPAAGMQKYLVAWKMVADPSLFGLHQRLLADDPYQKGPQTPFHPHMTIAFDDLSEDSFREVKARHAESKLNIPDFYWMCDNVAFYHFKQGRWQPFHVFALKGRTGNPPSM